jgi:hypothetical protein
MVSEVNGGAPSNEILWRIERALAKCCWPIGERRCLCEPQMCSMRVSVVYSAVHVVDTVVI